MGFLHSPQANAGTLPLQSIMCNHPSARRYNITSVVEKALLNKQESINQNGKVSHHLYSTLHHWNVQNIFNENHFGQLMLQKYFVNVTNLRPALPSSKDRGWFSRPRSSGPSVTTTERPIISHSLITLSVRRNVARPSGPAVMLPRSPACCKYKFWCFNGNIGSVCNLLGCDLGHCILLSNTNILPRKSRHKYQVIRGAVTLSFTLTTQPERMTSSKKSVFTYKTTQCHNTDDYRWRNFKVQISVYAELVMNDDCLLVHYDTHSWHNCNNFCDSQNIKN
jgi:hypothetical protein